MRTGDVPYNPPYNGANVWPAPGEDAAAATSRFRRAVAAWPADVSFLNSFQGKVVANAAIVPAGTNGSISVFVTNATDLIIDVNGYFAP